MDCSNSCPISQTETIILATDGSLYSEGAVREAIRFAESCSSTIIAVMAFESNPEYETIGGSAYDAQVTESRMRLDAIKELADKAGVPCETVLHTDTSPAAAVVAEAAARKADMIVIGRRGWKGLAKALIGEVAAEVIGKAACKVLVVPRAARIEYKHILAAVDGSKHSDAALYEAIAIAKRCGSSLLLLSAMRDESERVEAESLVRRAAEIAQKEGVQTEGVTPPGRSFNAIVETASGRSVDLIVMGTYGKSGFKKALLGSATEKVIGNAGCAVLVVKASS
jgi:nucleotide-binding universal stress UspA family protein